MIIIPFWSEYWDHSGYGLGQWEKASHSNASSYWLSFSEKDKELFILHHQYHGCWWPGDTRSQGISWHCIILDILEYSIFRIRLLQFTPDGFSIRNHSANGLSQWEMKLQCNIVSHWLSPYTEWSPSVKCDKLYVFFVKITPCVDTVNVYCSVKYQCRFMRKSWISLSRNISSFDKLYRMYKCTSFNQSHQLY